MEREEEVAEAQAPEEDLEAADASQASGVRPQETDELEEDPDETPEARGLRPEASEEPAPEPQPEPEEEDELAKALRERGEYLALAQRTQADFENWRKRAAKESANAGQRAKGGLLTELLPVVDNLERALASAGEEEQHLAEGVRLVHSGLLGVLERNGVEVFDPSGEKFDPVLHEAVSTRPDENGDSGVVLDVVEKGYRLAGNVLRPARVVVSG